VTTHTEKRHSITITNTHDDAGRRAYHWAVRLMDGAMRGGYCATRADAMSAAIEAILRYGQGGAL